MHSQNPSRFSESRYSAGPNTGTAAHEPRPVLHVIGCTRGPDPIPHSTLDWSASEHRNAPRCFPSGAYGIGRLSSTAQREFLTCLENPHLIVSDMSKAEYLNDDVPETDNPIMKSDAVRNIYAGAKLATGVSLPFSSPRIIADLEQTRSII
jgi:hypothetical protein